MEGEFWVRDTELEVWLSFADTGVVETGEVGDGEVMVMTVEVEKVVPEDMTVVTVLVLGAGAGEGAGFWVVPWDDIVVAELVVALEDAAFVCFDILPLELWVVDTSEVDTAALSEEIDRADISLYKLLYWV